MSIKVPKKFILSSFLLFSDIKIGLADERFCEIKFNIQIGEENLEKKLNIQYNSKFVAEKYNYDCYQIGLEHDKNYRPIEGKPIYACCHKI